ncbi:hypothetical protein [Soonwooa sp.]|uniref:hypothetical protein n=1 Tax=Soonwooa sp. TaxID=1938592 RepID=UPI00262AAA5B|nr:hypothetical protein [Soonwooa sp.]
MNKISRINQYLLERYPTIWNTKIVWMLALAFLFHLLFFAFGFFIHADPASLQKSRAVDDYFSSGFIFINLIISVLLLVGWLINMFKNNAFKNFYPVSSAKLFFQFVQYFIIIFSCTSFYFSYMFADKLNINRFYPDAEMSKNIKLINTTVPFLAQNYSDFTLGNRLYPKPFFDLYCETDLQKIDRTKKYFVYYNRAYQYYEVYSKVSKKKDRDGYFVVPEPEASNKTKIAYSETQQDYKTFYFKKDVVDLSPYILTTAPSFYNYSTIFYDQADDDQPNYYQGSNIDDSERQVSQKQERKRAEINKAVAELLDSKNRANFEKQFTSFFELAKKYKISTNLNAKSLTDLSFYPNNFEVNNFTKKYKPELNEQYDADRYMGEDYTVAATAAVDDAAVTVDSVYAETTVSPPTIENGKVVDSKINIKDFNPNMTDEESPDIFFKRRLKDYYFYSDSLKQVLENVDTIKNKDYFHEYIHLFLWIAFCLSTLILGFRTTGLRSVLFAVITAGVLSLIIGLLAFLINVGHYGSTYDYFILYAFFITGLLILIISITQKTFSKFINSIAVNISINTFVGMVMLLLVIINRRQINACEALITTEQYYSCRGFLDEIGMDSTSYFLLIVGFIFIFFYTKVLRKWKAQPE